MRSSPPGVCGAVRNHGFCNHIGAPNEGTRLASVWRRTREGSSSKTAPDGTMDETAPRRTGFRAEHPVFFWGTVSLIALLVISAAVVGSRIPRYNNEADE